EGDKKKLIKLIEWGDVEWSSFENAFYGCSELDILSGSNDQPDLSNVESMRYAFADTDFSIVLGMNAWAVNNVTDMSHLFDGNASFNGNLNAWNVENVTKMQGMFRGASSFDHNLESWDVSKVTDMNGMFKDAISFGSSGTESY